MKRQFNLTDSSWDLERFSSRRDLEDLLTGFDGIELMHMEEDPRGIISREMVVGYHITQPEYWLDFWREDTKHLLAELDTPENICRLYHGTKPDALVQSLRQEYDNAVRYGAEYLVVHVSDAGIFEEITGQYHYTDRDVIQGFCELMNEALPAYPAAVLTADLSGSDPSVSGAEGETASVCTAPPILLLENLWQPGLNFRDPQITADLMEGVRYPNKGIMLDTGHLMHTNLQLRTQKEAVRFIHRCLDEHGDLCRYIKGVHLNQSVSGSIMNRYRKYPPVPAADLDGRMNQLFEYVFSVDRHQPFVAEGVAELVSRIDPCYLTYEFITRNLEEHRTMLRRQQAVFGK